MNAPSPSSAAPAPQAPPNVLRQIALIVLLVALIGALAYDRLNARPASAAAFAKMEQLLEKHHKAAVGERVTPEDVRVAMGRQPTKVDGKTYVIERYQWRRGTLVATYNINVVYQKRSDGSLLLSNAFHNEAVPDWALHEVGKLEPAAAVASNGTGTPPLTSDALPSGAPDPNAPAVAPPNTSPDAPNPPVRENPEAPKTEPAKTESPKPEPAKPGEAKLEVKEEPAKE